MYEIIEINSKDELPDEIKLKLVENNLNIIFDEKSYICIENFLINNNKIKEYYVNKYSKIYIDLFETNLDIYFFLIECIYKAYDIINNCESADEKILFGNINEWIISICMNIMFEYPFTLDKVIFLPYNYIKECFISSNKLKLIETLIHEKLHIGQRYGEKIWEDFINKKDSNWKKIKDNNSLYKIINNFLEDEDKSLLKNDLIFISNPDTWYKDFKYLYQISNNLYYGHYVYNIKTKLLKKKYYLIDIQNNIFIETNEILDEEHPYETYAYAIAKKLISSC